MAWTLNFLLIVGGIVLVTYFHRTFQKIKKNAFVYPSDAVIDQIIPPEVLEHIFMNFDYGTLIACSEVSKYWRHHAIKDQIKDNVFNKETSLSLDKDLFAANISRSVLESISWLDYPATYPAKFRLDDLLFARNLGKQLIETNLKSAKAIHSSLNYATGNREFDKYLVKFRGKLYFQYYSKWNIRDNFYSTMIQVNELADGHRHQWAKDMECEIIVELKDVHPHHNMTNVVKRFRLLDNRTYIAGLAVDVALFQVGYLMILPCLIVDYCSSPASDAKNYLILTVHFLATFLTILTAVGIQAASGYNLSQEVKTKKRKYGMIIGYTLVALCLYFYQWSLDMTNYVMMLFTCTLYSIIWEKFINSNHRQSKLVAIISVCLIVLMNDWKTTVEAFKSGEILWTFLYNIFMHVQLGIILALYNLMTKSFTELKINWRNIYRWNTGLLEAYLVELLAVLFITLYAPITRRKLSVLSN